MQPYKGMLVHQSGVIDSSDFFFRWADTVRNHYPVQALGLNTPVDGEGVKSGLQARQPRKLLQALGFGNICLAATNASNSEHKTQ